MKHILFSLILVSSLAHGKFPHMDSGGQSNSRASRKLASVEGKTGKRKMRFEFVCGKNMDELKENLESAQKSLPRLKSVSAPGMVGPAQVCVTVGVKE